MGVGETGNKQCNDGIYVGKEGDKGRIKQLAIKSGWG